MFREVEVEEERDPVDVKLYPLYHSEALDRTYGNNTVYFQPFVKICNCCNEVPVKNVVAIFKKKPNVSFVGLLPYFSL